MSQIQHYSPLLYHVIGPPTASNPVQYFLHQSGNKLLYALQKQRGKLRGGGRCQRNAEAIQVHAQDLSLDYPIWWFSGAFLGVATILRPSEKLPSRLSLQPPSRQFSGHCWEAALMFTPAYTSVSHHL